jgi:hypothetical protein
MGGRDNGSKVGRDLQLSCYLVKKEYRGQSENAVTRSQWIDRLAKIYGEFARCCGRRLSSLKLVIVVAVNVYMRN